MAWRLSEHWHRRCSLGVLQTCTGSGLKWLILWADVAVFLSMADRKEAEDSCHPCQWRYARDHLDLDAILSWKHFVTKGALLSILAPHALEDNDCH